MNKERLFFAAAIMASPIALAQDLDPAIPAADTAVADSTICIVERINASEWISINQPEALDALLRRHQSHSTDTADENGTSVHDVVLATRNGYRVQVFDDNNPRTARQQAQQRQAQVAAAFPQWRAYVTFNSPYWQVRVGDFRRRGEAEAALAEIRESLPSVAAYARIVPEKINITE